MSIAGTFSGKGKKDRDLHLDQILSGPRSKTGDIRTEYMDGDGPSEEDGSKVKTGNDLDNVDIDPQFQV